MDSRRILNAVPKPPRSTPKEHKPLKRTRVKKYRAKARRGRLRGEEMSNLRIQSWEERKAICFYCKLPCAFEAGDLAHIRGKRMWGDNKENVSPAHKECHRLFHQYGPSMTKPCPSKNAALL